MAEKPAETQKKIRVYVHDWMIEDGTGGTETGPKHGGCPHDVDPGPGAQKAAIREHRRDCLRVKAEREGLRPTDVWELTRRWIDLRLQNGKGVSGICREIEQVLVSKEPSDPISVVLRFDKLHEIKKRAANGDDPDNSLEHEREASAAAQTKRGQQTAAPSAGGSYTSSPTEAQGNAQIELDELDECIAEIAEKHGVFSPGEAPCWVCSSDYRQAIDQLIAGAWSNRRIAEEVQHWPGMKGMTSKIIRRHERRHVGRGVENAMKALDKAEEHALAMELGQSFVPDRIAADTAAKCKACRSMFATEINAKLAAGETVRAVEEWLRGVGEEISYSTISRHDGHRAGVAK